MKKLNIKKHVKIILLIFLMIMSLGTINKVSAVEKGTLAIKVSSDLSKINTTREVVLTLKLTNFSKVDTNEPMAITAMLDYDKTVFKSVTLAKTTNGWNGEISQSNKILLDAGSIEEGKDIAKITLKLQDNLENVDTYVKITSINITNGENVNITNLNLSSRIQMSNIIQDEKTDNKPAKEETDKTGDEENSKKDEKVPTTPEEDKKDESANKPTTNSKPDAQVNKIEKVEDLTTSKDPIPQTGVSYTILAVIVVTIILGIIALFKYKKIYD